jgi:Cys-tRNA synthase (O-phospho-L-seryl-tRNA:Cys-tRNA synthase)
MVRAEGEVDLRDVETYLDDLVTQNAMAYAKLFDASKVAPIATDHDVMMLAARIRAYAATMEGGPLALVATTPAASEIVSRYINLASAKRPVSVFGTVEEAERWLDQQGESRMRS